MIGDLLEGRTRDEAVLIIGWFHKDGQVRFVCIGHDGTPKVIPLDQVSIDWHFDAEKGWLRDIDSMESDDGG